MSKTSLRSLAIGSKPAEMEAPKPQEDPQEKLERQKKSDDGRTSDVKPMSLRVPISMWRDLQLRRIDEARDVNKIIIDAIAQYLERAGGPHPGRNDR